MNYMDESNPPELWKDIEQYEGLYRISSYGRVMNTEGYILTPIDNHTGYLQIGLSKEGLRKTFYVHILVATAFVPNPLHLPEVNHKDTDGMHNHANNLEWCGRQYNVDYSKSIPVLQYTNGKFIKQFKSQSEASSVTGINQANINQCCNGKRKSAGGSEWIPCELTLATMFNMQEKLQQRLNMLNFITEQDRTRYIKCQAQYVDQELHEMLRELQFFKEWKQYPWTEQEKIDHFAAAKEELIDAVHFMINISLALGLDADEVCRLYMAKNNINHIRQDNNYGGDTDGK